jgi:hypothetical protein
MASFGEELKRERELRDISLKEIAEATKVSIRFLEALEQNNFDILPGGIFNRGFIRAYARFIGVDGEEMVNSYLHELAQREGKGSGGKNARTGGATAGATSPAAPSQPLSPGVFRPEQRVEPRKKSKTAEHVATIIAPEVRHAPFRSEPSATQSPSLALWLLVALGIAIGVVIISVTMMGRSPADAAADPHAESVKARLSRLSAGRQPSGTQPAPSGGTEPPPAALSGDPATGVSPTAGTPISGGTDPLAAQPTLSTAAPSATVGAAEALPAPIPEHSVRLQAAESTRVELECAGQVVLDQEFWPGQVKIVDCREPVVLSARNGGALQYSIDGGPPAFLGAAGQQIDGVVLAPVAPPPGATQLTPGVAPPPHAGN